MQPFSSATHSSLAQLLTGPKARRGPTYVRCPFLIPTTGAWYTNITWGGKEVGGGGSSRGWGLWRSRKPQTCLPESAIITHTEFLQLPSTLLLASNTRTHLILSATLGGGYWYPHVIDEETETPGAEGNYPRSGPGFRLWTKPPRQLSLFVPGLACGRTCGLFCTRK